MPEAFAGRKAKVFENPTWLPRAWSVRRVVKVDDSNAVYSRMLDPSFDPRKEAILDSSAGSSLPSSLEGIGEAASDPSDKVQFRQLTPNRLRLERVGSFPALVVVSQNWYPGWTATVNGIPAPVRRVYGTLMGVTVDSGTSQVEFSYLPTHFYAGMILTCLAVSALIVASLLILRGRQRG